MDRFNEYWEQLSNKSDPIGKELISYYKTLHESEDGSHLSERVCNFLLQNLLRNPYPTCQLLRLLATSRIPTKNSAIREICDAGMGDFLECFSAEKEDKFYNLIANNLLSSGAIDQVVPTILRMLQEGKVDRERLLLALVARRSQKLLKQFLREMKGPQEVRFLMEVIDGKRHFMESILAGGGQIPFQDRFVRDYIRLFQVVAEVNTGKAAMDVPVELDLPEGSALQMYHLELKRTQLLQGLFGQEDTLRMQDYAKESSVLALYLKQRKLIEPGSYEQLLEIIAKNDRLNHEILAGVDADQPEDYKLLQMLILWKHTMEMIQLPPQLHTFEAILEIKTNAIRNTLKSVDDVQIFVELLESLLTLLFVRYEHLSQKSTSTGGFMCSPAVLEAILNCLEVVVTQRKHATNYVDANDHLKQRLSDCLAIINDTLWRLSLFKEMSSTKDSQLQLTDADSANIILKLPDLVQDDEDRVYQSVDLDAPKRRHSKRHQRYSQPSSSGSTSHKLLTTQHSLPLPNKLPAAESSLSSLSFAKPKALFSKILGSPERLATLCLVNKNLEAARAIVKTRNLTATHIGQDLAFLDNFTQVQDKLSSLIASYDRMRSQEATADDPLKEIRSRTAIGFEASKIVSTVENFALGQRIDQSDEDRQLLEKHSAQYPFLRLFHGDPLKNIHAVDLLLGLPMSYDLNLALYNLVEKSIGGGGGAGSEGYAGFLKRLIDDLHQYKLASDGHKEVTFHELLSREVCPLDPAKLGAVLESRSQVGALRSLEDVPAGRSVVFRKIQRFVEQIEKLLKLHGEWDESFRSSDAMRQDLQEIVSRLVFEKGVALNQLEPMVAGTNTNLTHIIARNYVDEVGKSPSFDLTARPEAVEYVNGKNDLLGALLKQIVNGSGDHVLLNNLNALPSVTACKDLYGNVTAAALDYDRFGLELLEAIDDDLERLNLLELIAERWNHREGDRIEVLRHEIVSRLIESGREDVPLEQLIMRTKDVRRQAEYLLRVIDRFPKAQTIIHLIETVQLSKDVSELSSQTQESLGEWLSKLQVYIEVGKVLENDDWRTVQSLSESNKELVLYQLVQQNLYDLCSRWIRIHPLHFNEEDSRLLDVFTLALTKASRESNDCSALLQIIEGLPAERVVRFYETILLGVKSEAIIRHAIEYLERNGDNRKIYQKYRISLEIFAHLPAGNSERLWHLISRPLLIVEQFLMNSKLELLNAVMGSVRPLLVAGTVCQICFEQREYIRDLRRRISGSINLDSSHDDQYITNECVDSLLRIYAGKALDYRVSNDSATSGESMHEQSLSSLDSLCGAFVMPKEAPTKDGWVRDEDASHCMCCRRSVFSMLNRRHHCRRCGRVVCHGCSKKKLVIPELYEEVPVRACDDCVKQSQQAKLQVPAQNSGKVTTGSGLNESSQDEWQLTGNVRNDNILREEYSYEYAPSTSQCLAICNLHSQNDEISSFLLYHCVNLETLLRPIHPGYPNPEIDYALVARMLLNLTLAAKVRGLDFAEADKIKEHAEIILSMVKNDCESLLLQESMSSANLRKLRDALVRSEKWSLALELSTKCGFATSGVMAAWGNTCLRAGCYETAREKFSHCLQRMSTDADNSTILNCIESPETKLASYRTAIPLKRPPRSPPLLLEIISILESTAQAQPPEVIARASKIKSSNTSLASSGRIKNNAPLHEPALNVLNTLANLKHIAKGNFTDFLPERRALRNRDLKQPLPGNSTDYLHGLDCIMSTWFFEESMFYLLSYAAHQDIVAFLVKHRQILPAMKYILMQHVDPEVFLSAILLPYVRRGKLELIIEVMGSMDETLLIWKNYIIHTCRYLEANRMLNCLYNLQLLLGDPIRASMTCVRFYSMDAKSFTDLEANTFHLKNSVSHLEAELELCHWDQQQQQQHQQRRHTSTTHKSLLMKMDPKELNSHINTILRQLEVAKYLAHCEAKGRDVIGLLPKLFIETARIPTLFGNGHERLQLAVLVLICGKNVDEGFGLSYRVIQDFSLSSLRVYTLTAKFFINESRIEEVEKLLQAIVGSGGPSDAADTAGFCDELVRNCVEMAIGAHGSSSHIKTALEALIKRVADVGTKIHCYCVTGQLKSAYLLANRTGRLSDVRKILRQAEVLNQGHVKRLCQAKLAGEGGSGGSGAMARKSTG